MSEFANGPWMWVVFAVVGLFVLGAMIKIWNKSTAAHITKPEPQPGNPVNPEPKPWEPPAPEDPTKPHKPGWEPQALQQQEPWPPKRPKNEL